MNNAEIYSEVPGTRLARGERSRGPGKRAVARVGVPLLDREGGVARIRKWLKDSPREGGVDL
jgi:hypothetical protein